MRIINAGYFLRKIASKLLKEVLKARNITNLPVVFLGGLCEDNDWRKEIQKEFKNKFFFLDPYDKNWDPKDNIYDELAGMLSSDYVVFFKGGKGSAKEQRFMDVMKKGDYKNFNRFQDLKDYLNKI
jgi:hypothetical protein